jgi:hypothetical protein
MGGWLGTRVGAGASKSMTAMDEHAALQEAMAAAALIVNDEVEKAEQELGKGNSPFHKLGRATALFLRATLGFEKDVMEQASTRLAEAEDSAWDHHRRAVRDPSTSHQSKIYPPGAEYALCHAEAQLMSAVVAVLNESLTESLRGFYKLRKAFGTLHEINEAEKSYLRSQGLAGAASQQSSAAASSSTLQSDTTQTDLNDEKQGLDDLTPTSSEDGLEFVDAEEKPSDDKSTNAADQLPNIKDLNLQDSTSQNSQRDATAIPTVPIDTSTPSYSAATEADQQVDFRTLTSDTIDLFIHSGNSLCFGLLQLLLSMIPPAFGKLLSLFSFRGDRQTGLRMLWEATKYKHDINGAMAGLITLGFHNAAIGFCDILSKDALPETRLRSLLKEMRELYPGSKLWLLEECRILSRDHRLEESVEKLTYGPKSSLKQVEALGLFEKSLSLMYLHRYQECADSFISCVSMNNWSHAMYYYIAGACYVELYRIHKISDPKKAEDYAAKAEKHLREVPTHTGKKRFMARQLPFDVFVGRKITKWDARAKARECSFVDAVGVSPVTEMSYFWSGFTRMAAKDLRTSLERLAWSDDPATNPGWEDEAADEKAVLSFLRGAVNRFLGNVDDAESALRDDVLSHDLHQLKACEHPDTWPLPVAHYELSVVHWQRAGGEEGDKAEIHECSKELEIVENWEAYELDARIGMKIRTARETLKRVGSARG